MFSYNELPFKEGDRVMTTESHEWTIDECQDYPLIVSSGDMATIVEININAQQIELLWDKDTCPRLKKIISFRDVNTLIKIKSV